MYSVEEKNNYFIKENVSLKEYKTHNYVYNLGIVNMPKIIHYDKKTKQMTMEKFILDLMFLHHHLSRF